MSVVTAKLKVLYPEWHKAFSDWCIVADKDIVSAWRQQGKLIAERLINGTSGGSWNRATPPGNQKQGRMAMERDIKRAIFPITDQGFRDIHVKKKVAAAVRSEDVGALQKMAQAGVFGEARKGMKVFPNANIWAAHQNSRVSRGRVTMKVPNNAVPGTAGLREYIAKSRGAVGQGKGGWAASLFKLGGNCKDWIARHVKSGTCVDNLQPGRESLSFTMINRSKWASGGDDERIIDKVMEDRAAAIQADIANRLEYSFKHGKPMGK